MFIKITASIPKGLWLVIALTNQKEQNSFSLLNRGSSAKNTIHLSLISKPLLPDSNTKTINSLRNLIESNQFILREVLKQLPTPTQIAQTLHFNGIKKEYLRRVLPSIIGPNLLEAFQAMLPNPQIGSPIKTHLLDNTIHNSIMTWLKLPPKTLIATKGCNNTLKDLSK